MENDEAKVVANIIKQVEGLKQIESVKQIQEQLRNLGKELRAKEPREETKGEVRDVAENIERKVYVTNINPETTLDQLKDLIGKAGTIAFAKFTYKGFKVRKASIEFESEDSVQKAIDQFNETDLQEFKLEVSKFVLKERAPRERKERVEKPRDTAPREAKPRAARTEQAPRERQPRRQEPRETKQAQEGGVYIGNLAYAVDDKMFSDFVYGFGKTKEVYIQKDNRGRSKGYGIVVFRYPQDAEKAIKELDGLELEGRKVFARSDKGDTEESTFKGDSEETRGGRGGRGRGARGAARGSQ